MQHNCKILHYVNPNPFKSSNIHKRGNSLIEFVCKNKDNYIVVATPTLTCKEENVLNNLYNLTNSINTAWYENIDAKPSTKAKEGCRSTSIGDLLLVDEKEYVVDSFGFTLL